MFNRIKKRLTAFALALACTSSLIPSQVSFARAGSYLGGSTQGGAHSYSSSGGGGALQCEAYAVTILDEKFRRPLDPKAKDSWQSNVTYQFSKAFPAYTPGMGIDYLYILPTNTTDGANGGTDNSRNSGVDTVLNYSTSSGLYTYTGDDATSRMYKPSNGGSIADCWTGIDKVRVKINSGGLKSLQDGGWQNIMNTSDVENILNFMFGNGSANVAANGSRLMMNNYPWSQSDIDAYGPKCKEEWEQAAFIAVMTSLWWKGYYSSSLESYFRTRTEEYISGKWNDTWPPIINIETAGVFSGSAGTSVINSVDLCDYYYGANSQGSARTWQYGAADSDTLSILGAAAGVSNSTAPENTRYNMGDYVMYGFGLVSGVRISSDSSGYGEATMRGGGYMPNLYLESSNHFGFNLIWNNQLVPDTSLKGRQDITAGEDTVKLPFKQHTIGQDVTVTLDTEQKDQTVKDMWKGILDKSASVDIKVSVKGWKDGIQEPYILVCNEGVPNSADGSDATFNMTKESMQSMIDGADKLTYTDPTRDVPIESYVKFTYESDVLVKPLDAAGNPVQLDTALGLDADGWLKLDPDDGKAWKAFERDQVPKPSYTSVPEAYSEIKQNEPKNEEFEAMAGAPTTRPFYFASGGSEFVVDINLEYVPNQTTTRKYELNLTDVDCDVDHIGVNDDGSTYIWHHDCNDDFKWTQTITYDYMKITSAKVWKIEKSKVGGMKKLVPVDSDTDGVITAEIVGGSPTAYFFTDETNTSKGGRLRYSLEPEQGDSVYWEEESSDRCGSWHSDNLKTLEGYKNRSNTAYVQSDFLILHTSSGDQVVNYSDTTGTALTKDPIRCDPKTQADLWDNNPLCASQWDPGKINTCWYNSHYETPEAAFDTDGDGFNFRGQTVMEKYTGPTGGKEFPNPASPNSIELWKQFNPLVTYKNGEYIVGESDILYKNIIDYTCKGGSAANTYSKKFDPYTADWVNNKYTDATDKDLIVHSVYSPKHKKVNDIVIHDPVSSEKSYVISLPAERDQRTDSDKALSTKAIEDASSNPKESTEVITNPNYHNNLVFNGDMSIASTPGYPLGWVKFGNGTFPNGGGELRVVASDNSETGMYQDIPAQANESYNITGKMKSDGGAILSVTFLNSTGGEIGSPTQTGNIKSSSYQSVTMTDIKAPASAVALRIKITSTSSGTSYLDDVTGICASKAGFIYNNIKVYDEVPVANPAYHSHAESGCTLVSSSNSATANNAKYVYYYRNIDTGDIVKSSNRIYILDGNGNTTGQALKDLNDGLTVDPTAKFTLSCISFEYDATGGVHADTLDNSIPTEVWSCGLEDTSKAVIVPKASTFVYTGGAQIFVAPETGDYEVASWGAKGGSSFLYDGGDGASVTGTVHLNKGDKLTIAVGGRGSNAQYGNIKEKMPTYHSHLDEGCTYTTAWSCNTIDSNLKGDPAMAISNNGGFNLGANSGLYAGSGGGETDVRIYRASGSTLDDRILVAGGGGGASRNGPGKDAGKDLDTTHAVGYGQTQDYEPASNPSDPKYNDPNVIAKLEVYNYGSGGGGFRGGNYGTDTVGGEGGSNFSDTSYFNNTFTGDPTGVGPYDGNGMVRIKYLDNRDAQPKFILGKALASTQYNNTVPPEASTVITHTNKYAQTGNTKTGVNNSGCFINLDYGFSIYFPNNGDFYQTNKHGISSTTAQRGLGFVDDMDTTEWTQQKYVQFPFDVVYNGGRYKANTKIFLPVEKVYFDFYCTLGNNEFRAATVKFVALAVNDGYTCPPSLIGQQCTEGHSGLEGDEHNGCYPFKNSISGNGKLDNSEPTNRERNSRKAAKHSAYKTYYTDVVGRIGNFMIQDVGDPRFANFFKQSVEPSAYLATHPDSKSTGGWMIPNVVKNVDESKQNLLMGHTSDLRGINEESEDGSIMTKGNSGIVHENRREPESVNWMYQGAADEYVNSMHNYDPNGVLGKTPTTQNAFLNTYGLHLNEHEQLPYTFPLSPGINNIEALRTQPIRLGYPVYQNIDTIGNYSKGTVQVLPYYYALNLNTGGIQPVDIYMSVNQSYKPINLFNGAYDATIDPDNKDTTKRWVYDNKQYIDWDAENVRRNSSYGSDPSGSGDDWSDEWYMTKAVEAQYPIVAPNASGVATTIPSPILSYGIEIPHGQYYSPGNNQLLLLNGRCRTFVGSGDTYGEAINRRTGVNSWDFNPMPYVEQAQRWHFPNNLPSSAVAVKQGVKPSTSTIAELRNDNYVLLCALDIKAKGSVFSLQSDGGSCNEEPLVIGDKSYDISKINNTPGNPYPGKVTTVITIDKSSKDDLSISGTH